MPEFDRTDALILNAWQRLFDRRRGARVGDFIVMLDGTLRRFTHDHGPEYGLQVTSSADDDGRFYLSPEGSVSYSGGLDPCVKSYEDTGDTKEGAGWLFHHGDRRAHNGVDCLATFRVYRQRLDVPGVLSVTRGPNPLTEG